MNQYISSDINLIKECYYQYSFVKSGNSIPDFSLYLHTQGEFIFNNSKYTANETLDLINIFCKNMDSIKVDILNKIECLNVLERSYLMLSNWNCVTLDKHHKVVYPMMQIIKVNSSKIIKTIGVINMKSLILI